MRRIEMTRFLYYSESARDCRPAPYFGGKILFQLATTVMFAVAADGPNAPIFFTAVTADLTENNMMHLLEKIAN